MKTENKSRRIFEFENKVLDTAEKYGMFKDTCSVTVALSGGADSVSLLFSLFALSKKLCIAISACHLNHGIRGKEAEADMNFSYNLCEKYGIPFYSETLDIPAICKKSKGSLETVARNERYAFFERAKHHFGSQKIATAHTMSDNTETVLFNLCRGSSSDGMCGIPPTRDSFVRPLIAHTRSEVEQYLSCLEQNYVSDSTNFDEEYTRNFIRNTIVPDLKRINPSLDAAVFRLSEIQRADRNFFENETAKLLAKKLSAKELSLLPESLITRYIKEICKKNIPASCHLPENRIKAIADAAIDISLNGGKKEISLPGALCAHVSESGIEISSSEKQEFPGFDIPLHVGKNIINQEYAVLICESEKTPDIIENHELIYRLYKKISVSSDIISNDISARNRMAGDKIRIGGMSRLLKKVFSESELSPCERQLIPVIYCNDGIIAVPFFDAPSDFSKPIDAKNTANIAFYKKI